ncbi:patatin-like phospholipase family protein [Romboutsia sp.]|uniref:patatin-like phospholipase family protein n=1 Tax=Romboutsia sp. TaxID=1965302 RepID=UPI002C0C106B|nr:patatin-like phospholipase family protein [Romboutsia sp.]HSQ89527.1 patatin-like phospholipase family protein [Romboutsia sp.]
MRIGLCLSGGGAKGSYQAGVVKGLYDRGINKFDVISGTSIGAINGYYIFTGNVENLEKMWINIDSNPENDIKIVDNTVDNSYAIDELKRLINRNQQEMDFYVNYIEIENKNVREKVVNICKENKEDALNSVKYSALLPCNPNATLSFNQQFMKDVNEGLYDGYKLDGGLVNNTLIEPLFEKNVDKVIVISTANDYVLPDEVKNKYNTDNIIVARPKTIFEKNDILRFEKEFCTKIYKEGYEIGKNLEINI